jgi:hypothetical protein
MTLPTVIEITPQLEAVTPDTFIDTLAAATRERLLRDGARTATAERERSSQTAGPLRCVQILAAGAQRMHEVAMVKLRGVEEVSLQPAVAECAARIEARGESDEVGTRRSEVGHDDRAAVRAHHRRVLRRFRLSCPRVCGCCRPAA